MSKDRKATFGSNYIFRHNANNIDVNIYFKIVFIFTIKKLLPY